MKCEKIQLQHVLLRGFTYWDYFFIPKQCWVSECVLLSQQDCLEPLSFCRDVYKNCIWQLAAQQKRTMTIFLFYFKYIKESRYMTAHFSSCTGQKYIFVLCKHSYLSTLEVFFQLSISNASDRKDMLLF